MKIKTFFLLIGMLFTVNLQAQHFYKESIIQYGDTISFKEIKVTPALTNSSANSFTEINTVINGVNHGFCEWVDYNSDGYLDISINGTKIGDGNILHGTIFRNEGNNTFVKAEITGIAKAIYGDQDWGDYNNDGYADLILIGTRSGFNEDNITEIHKNVGNDTFVKINHNLPMMSRGNVKWGDFDGDGDLDIFLMGLDTSLDFVARVYENTGADQFVESTDILTGGHGRINFIRNSSKWADFDNDGDLDGILGYSTQTGGYGVKLFENLGGLEFQEKEVTLPQYNYTSIDVFDYNNDNQIDIAISGNEESSVNSDVSAAFLTVLENKGNLQFETIYENNTGIYWGEIDCGDFNNDGYSDILLSGAGNYARRSFILENQYGKNFGFREVGLPSSSGGGIQWGRLNPSNSLDIFMHGSSDYSSSDAFSSVFKNQNTGSNEPPSIPAALRYSLTENELSVSWQASTDDLTGQFGVSYNVRLGTSPDTFDIISGQSTEAGVRKLVEMGNNGTKTTFKFSGLPIGTYYFQVQAVDNAFNGSAYSETLSICHPGELTLPDSSQICSGDSVVLDAGDFTSYLWNTGDTTRTIHAYTEGWYSVEIETDLGCQVTDSVFVTVNELPELTISDTTIYDTDIITISAGDFESYLWSNGSTESQIEIKANALGLGEHEFSVEVRGASGCGSVETFFIYVEPNCEIVSVTLPDSTQVCSGDSVVLDAGDFTSYLWNTGDTTRTIHAYTEGWYSVEIETDLGCQVTDSVYVTVNESPELSIGDTTIYDTDIITISAGDFESYLWSNGSTEPQIAINANALGIGEHEYSVEVTGTNGCMVQERFLVTVSPVLSAGEKWQEAVTYRFKDNKLELVNKAGETYDVAVYAVNGKIYATTTVLAHSTLTIPLAQKGLLILSFKSETNVYKLKVFVE